MMENSDLIMKYIITFDVFLFCRRVNVCMTQLLDTVLGLILMYFLMHNNKAQYLANICLAYGDVCDCLCLIFI